MRKTEYCSFHARDHTLLAAAPPTFRINPVMDVKNMKIIHYCEWILLPFLFFFKIIFPFILSWLVYIHACVHIRCKSILKYMQYICVRYKCLAFLLYSLSVFFLLSPCLLSRKPPPPPVTQPYVCVLTFDCPNGSAHTGNSIKATLACRCCET